MNNNKVVHNESIYHEYQIKDCVNKYLDLMYQKNFVERTNIVVTHNQLINH